MAKQIRFLLVDDDVDDTLLFQDVLNEVDSSIHFFSASDGEQAIHFLEAPGIVLPDLIFLDLNMPKMGGKECLAKLKQDDRFKHIPVIIYTTSSQSRDIEEVMMNGATGFITKPSNMKILKNILEAITGNLSGNLEKTLRSLSKDSHAFIVC